MRRERREAEWYERQEKREAEWDAKREKWEEDRIGFLQEISDRLDALRGPILSQARVFLHEKGYKGGNILEGKPGKRSKTSIGIQSEEQEAGPSGTGESEKGKGKEKEKEGEQMEEN